MSLTFLNRSIFDYGRWVGIVYLQDPKMDYHHFIRDNNESCCSLTGCDDLYLTGTWETELHMDQVRDYVNEALSYGAIIGPFQNLQESFHTSPLMTRDKQDSI